jgi:phosphohistidine phosphatase SixA
VSGVPDALLLDEIFSPAIATYIAARGIDCRAVVTDPVLRAQSDLEIFQAALAEDRVLVTNNVPDFERLRRAHEAAGNQVPDLIYTSDLTFPRTEAYVSRLGAALAAAAVGPETARFGGVVWLRPPA